jgi:hypothetical protein
VNRWGRTHEVGSYGAAVLRDRDGRPLLLTAAHVLGSLSAAHSLGQTEVLLGVGLTASAADPRIGQVIESHPPEPCTEVHLDACLVKIDGHITLNRHVRETILSAAPREIADEDEPIIVYKRGINAPGLTEGLLDPTPVSLRVELPQPGGPSIRRDYMRGYFVHGTEPEHPFARGGDSGSVVIDEDDCVLGMVVALRTDSPHAPLPSDPAFIVPITDVLAGLRVRLHGPNRACTLR